MSSIHFEKKILRCCGPYNADHHNNKFTVCSQRETFYLIVNRTSLVQCNVHLMRSLSSQWQCVYVCAYPFRMQHALIGPLFSAILVVQNFLAVWSSDQNYTIWWLRIRCNKHVVKNGWVKKPLGGKIINRSFSVSALQTEASITFFTFYQHQVKVLRLHHILSDGYTSP